MIAAAAPASFGEVVAFWREGGLRLVEPLAARGAAARGVAILVQPDGDMVMSVPGDFGADPGDLAAGQALVDRASEAVRRIAGEGFGRLAARVVMLIDVGTGGAVVGGWVLASAHATLVSLALGGAGTVLAWLLRRRLLPWAERIAVARLRRRIG